MPSARHRTLTGDPARYDGGLRGVADGVWAWIQPNGGWGEANAGLVIGGDAALLVDTLWDERLADEMLAEMAGPLGDRPLRYVFNTHSDGDHWWGNRAVPPAAEILTTTASRLTMDADATPGELARLARLSGVGARVPGPFQAFARYVHTMLSPFDFGSTQVRYPDRDFASLETVDLGGRQARMIKVGPAHTPGDAIVYIPDAGVVFAADVLFVGATPVMWFGPLEGWLAALDTVLSLEASVYIPGHGPVCARAQVVEMREYMSWIGDVVRSHHAAGASALDSARAATRAPEFARWRGWVAPERIVITVDTIHRALSGKPPVGISTNGRAKLFRQVATLGQELADQK